MKKVLVVGTGPILGEVISKLESENMKVAIVSDPVDIVPEVPKLTTVYLKAPPPLPEVQAIDFNPRTRSKKRKKPYIK